MLWVFFCLLPRNKGTPGEGHVESRILIKHGLFRACMYQLHGFIKPRTQLDFAPSAHSYPSAIIVLHPSGGKPINKVADSLSTHLPGWANRVQLKPYERPGGFHRARVFPGHYPSALSGQHLRYGYEGEGDPLEADKQVNLCESPSSFG